MTIKAEKRGNVYRVAVEPNTLQPLSLSFFGEELGFMQTYNNIGEVRASYPGVDFEFLEAPPTPQHDVGPLSPELQRQLDKACEREGLKVRKPAPARTVAVSAATTQPLPPTSQDSVLDKSLEFLARLTTAREYASRKNQAVLDVKIATVKELIAEVFK